MKIPTFLRPAFGAAAVALFIQSIAVPAAAPAAAVVLTGFLDSERVLEALPGAVRAAREYEPHFRAIDGLHGFAKPARIEVFLGTWDENGQELIAALLKTLEEAFNPAIEVVWIGVSRDLGEPPEARRAGVERVPTIIVRMEGKEKGRIVAVPDNSLEEDLATILLGVPFSEADLDLFRARPHSHLPIDCAPCHLPVPAKAGRPAAS